MIELEEIRAKNIGNFVEIHYPYLVQDGLIADDEDKEYFQSDEYRHVIL